MSTGETEGMRSWIVETPVRGRLTSIIQARSRLEAEHMARSRCAMDPADHHITWTGNHRVVREDRKKPE